MLVSILWEVYACVVESHPDDRPAIARAFLAAERALTEGDREPALLILWGYAPSVAEEVTARW